MGVDRYWESKFLAEGNFWPARGLLVEIRDYMKKRKPLDKQGDKLLLRIEELLARTEQR